MDVLITGAGGTVGTAITETLGDDDRYDFTLLDVETSEEAGSIAADVRDYEDVRPHFEGQDAVIHLALTEGFGSHLTDPQWGQSLADELEAITNVYGAAVEAGVERVVFASTNQLVVRYRRDGDAGPSNPVGTNVPIRPDSLYGVAKGYGEVFGRFCAERHGLRVYLLRLGWVQAADPGDPDDPYRRAERGVRDGEFERGSDAYEARVAGGVWLSRRDAAAAFARCLDDDTVTCDVFNVVSDNADRWLDIERTREVLRCAPRDAAEDYGPPA